jgi:hypothetical protein
MIYLSSFRYLQHKSFSHQPHHHVQNYILSAPHTRPTCLMGSDNGWIEASVRLLARHFLQFASSEVKKKAFHGFQCGLLWLPLEDCGTFPTILSWRSAGTTNSHLSQCWTNRVLAKSAELVQGQIILLSSCCCVKRHVESPIFGLKSAVSRQQSAAAPLWGCKIPISCNEVLHPLLMTLQ